MTFEEFKSTINLIESATPSEGWEWGTVITLLGDVVLKLDHVEKQVDDAVDRISGALDK